MKTWEVYQYGSVLTIEADCMSYGTEGDFFCFYDGKEIATDAKVESGERTQDLKAIVPRSTVSYIKQLASKPE